MTKKLSALTLANLPEGEYPDALTPGLIFRPGKKRKPWVVRYRQGGTRHKQIIGFYPAMGLKEARETAGDILKRVEAGQLAEPPKVIHPQSPDVLTIGKLIDKYEKMRTKEGVRTKSLPLAMRTVRNGLKDYLPTPADQFGKADLKAARAKIFERAPIQANRFMAYLGPVMKWGVQELDAFEHNFHGDLRKGKERKRSRVLTDDEIAAVWNATFAMEEAERSAKGWGNKAVRSYARLVRFLMLTAQRLDEGASLTHGEVIDGNWRFKTKGDKPHRLRLSPQALVQIGTGGARDLCFPGQRGKISGWSKLKEELDEASGVSDWRIHDLRRSAATRMEEIGHDAALVHFILNHGRQGLSAVYLHSDLYDRMAAALTDWANAVENIVGPKRAA